MVGIDKKGVVIMVVIIVAIIIILAVAGLKILPKEKHIIKVEAESMSRTSGKTLEGFVMLDRNANLSSMLNIPASGVGKKAVISIAAKGGKAESRSDKYELRYFIISGPTVSMILNGEGEGEPSTVEITNITTAGRKSRQAELPHDEMKGIIETSLVPYKTYFLPTGESVVDSVTIINDLEFSRQMLILHTEGAWPVLTVLLDGKTLEQVEVSSSEASVYRLTAIPSSLNSPLEIRFENWATTNQTGEAKERNLFIDNITMEIG